MQLISAVRDAHRRPNNTTSVAMMAAIQSTIQSSIMSSLGIVREASSALVRAEKELKAIQEKIQNLVDIMPILENQYDFTPEIMIQSSRDVIAATAGIVLATTQDAVIDNCNKAHDSMETLIKFARAAAEQQHIDKVTQDKVKKALKNSGKYVVSLNYVLMSYSALVQLVNCCNLTKNDAATRAKLNAASNNVSNSINELVTTLRLLPEAKEISLVDETEDNLADIAESELQKCARIIEEAAAVCKSHLNMI